MTVNADGSEKRKAMVIGRAYTPDVFKHAKINRDKLPVVYRYNKKAWMLSGLWYEYLGNLNKDMATVDRKIVLVMDNCPSHPPVNRPPKDYNGPPPPELTHITLVYLPKNTTPYFQPLDQGIIRSFKAGYRRKYARHLVQSFNSTKAAPKPIDILQAIHFISEAWMELPPAIIFNCWQEAGIHPLLKKSSQQRQIYEEYWSYLQTGTSIAIDTLLDLALGGYHSGQAESMLNNFLFHDEDSVNVSISLKSIDIPELISDMELGQRLESNLELLSFELESTIPPPAIPVLQPPSTSDTLRHLAEVTPYIEALPVTTLPHPGNHHRILEMSSIVADLQNLRLALQSYQQANKRQQSLLTWLTPQSNRDLVDRDSN